MFWFTLQYIPWSWSILCYLLIIVYVSINRQTNTSLKWLNEIFHFVLIAAWVNYTIHVIRTQYMWSVHKTCGPNTIHMVRTQTCGLYTKHVVRTQYMWSVYNTCGPYTIHMVRTHYYKLSIYVVFEVYLLFPKSIWTKTKSLNLCI